MNEYYGNIQNKIVKIDLVGVFVVADGELLLFKSNQWQIYEQYLPRVLIKNKQNELNKVLNLKFEKLREP